MNKTVAEYNERCDTFWRNVLAQPQNQKPCCFKGCHACCSEPVYASNAEVDYILAGLTDDQKEQVADKVCDWLEKVSGILHEKMPDAVKYRQLEAPCPLLKNGLCSVYERRPMGCRSFFALGNPLDCNLPARKHQKFATIPDKFFFFVGIPPALNDVFIQDHLGVLLLERLHGIGHFSGSRREIPKWQIHKMKKTVGEL